MPQLRRQPTIDVRVIDVQPHPDQATSNPNCWAVQFEVTYGKTKRTFWRWYNDRVRHGWTHAERNPKPRTEDVIRRFWDDTFAELHGFAFDEKAEGSP